jgi:hypothetical protein
MPRVPGIGELRSQVKNVPAPAAQQSSFVPNFNVKASDDLATKVIAPAAKVFSDLAFKIQSDNNEIAARKGTLAFRKEFNDFIFGESSFLNQLGENATPEALAAHQAGIGEIVGRHTEGQSGPVGRAISASVDQTVAQHSGVLGKHGADQRTAAAKTQEKALAQQSVDGFIRATATVADEDGGFSGAIETSRQFLADLAASTDRAGEKAGLGSKAIAENIETAIGAALTSAVTSITNSDAVDSGRRAKAFIDAFGHLTDDKVVSGLKKGIRETVQTQAILDGADTLLANTKLDTLAKQMTENKRLNKGKVRIGIEERLKQAWTLKDAEVKRVIIEDKNESSDLAIQGILPINMPKKNRDAILTQPGLWERLTKTANRVNSGQAISPTPQGNTLYDRMLELFDVDKLAFLSTDLSVPLDIADPDFIDRGRITLSAYELLTPTQWAHLKRLRSTIRKEDAKKEAKDKEAAERAVRGTTVVRDIKRFLDAKGIKDKATRGAIANVVHDGLEIRLEQGEPVTEEVKEGLVDAAIIEQENKRGGLIANIFGAHPDVFVFEREGEGSIVGFKELNVDLTFRDVVAQSTKDHLLKIQGEINATLRAEGVQGVHIDSITQIAEELTKEGRLVASDEVMRRVQDLLADPTTRVETAGQETSPPPPKAPVSAPLPAPPAPVVVGAQPPAREPVTAPAPTSELGPLGTEISGVTSEGRNVYRNPDGTESSERTATVEMSDGRWINVPTIFAGKEVSSDQALDIILDNKLVDPETGKTLPTFDNQSDAETFAEERSKNIKVIPLTEPEPEAFTGIPVVDEAIRALTGGAQEVPQEILDALPEEFVAKEIELSDAEVIAAGKVAKLIVKREERLGEKIKPGRLEKETEKAKQRIIEAKQDISALQEADIALKRAQSRLVAEQKIGGAKVSKLSAEEFSLKNKRQIEELKKVRQDMRRLQSGLKANITDFLTESSTERIAVDEEKEAALDEERIARELATATTLEQERLGRELTRSEQEKLARKTAITLERERLGREPTKSEEAAIVDIITKDVFSGVGPERASPAEELAVSEKTKADRASLLARRAKAVADAIKVKGKKVTTLDKVLAATKAGERTPGDVYLPFDPESAIRFHDQMFGDKEKGDLAVKVALQAVERIFPGGQQFLERVALVESKFGEHRNTFRAIDPKGGSTGIWQTDRNSAFKATMDTVSHPGLKRVYKKLEAATGINWPRDIEFRDLEKPFISALAARIFLLTKRSSIPPDNDIPAQAKYWKKTYNTGKGKGTEQRFIDVINKALTDGNKLSF